MEILDLRCFLALVDEGNVTKAASVLHMSQPNLSRHLLRLEDEIGKPLYERDPKHAKLTQAGRDLLEYASSIIKLVDEASVEVGKGSTDIKGQIHLGFGDSESLSYILDAIVATCRRYPGIAVHMAAGSSLTLLDRLNRGQLDFVFEVEHVSRVEYQELVIPGVDVWGVYPLPESPLTEKAVIEPQDLVGEPLIISRQILKSSLFKQWAGEYYDS